MIRAAVVGYGNTGQAAVEAIRASSDFELAGVVRRSMPDEPCGYPVATGIAKLGRVDAALLCTPTRLMPDTAETLLRQGISTVDSFDVHSGILSVRKRLDPIAQENGRVAVVASGWDPGSDSVIRALMQAMTPAGVTFTNFGPGVSMGHSAAARSVNGVKDAISMTIPKGTGQHRRMVYVSLDGSADFETVKAEILADPYFSHDESYVNLVEDVSALRNASHGVNIDRLGASGTTSNQRFVYAHTVDGAALTAAMLVASARAALRLKPGAYTLIEIPMVDFLPGRREEWIEKLV
jgi:diaminopimelate dehydrogenase